jgi:hybrid cluster-associated redox disulfide protein
MENQVITAEMSIGEVISKYPDTIQVFFQHGLGCVGCAVAQFENIRQGALAHGINLDLLMKDLNQTAQPVQ